MTRNLPYDKLLLTSPSSKIPKMEIEKIEVSKCRVGKYHINYTLLLLEDLLVQFLKHYLLYSSSLCKDICIDYLISPLQYPYM